MTKSALEAAFLETWRLFGNSLGLRDYLPEAQVMLNAPHSRHVWDFVWRGPKIVLEIQGGTWLPGRTAHSGGTGATKDAKKANLAALLGYTTIYATSDMLNQTHIVEFMQVVAEALKQRMASPIEEARLEMQKFLEDDLSLPDWVRPWFELSNLHFILFPEAPHGT